MVDHVSWLSQSRKGTMRHNRSKPAKVSLPDASPTTLPVPTSQADEATA